MMSALPTGLTNFVSEYRELWAKLTVLVVDI